MGISKVILCRVLKIEQTRASEDMLYSTVLYSRAEASLVFQQCCCLVPFSFPLIQSHKSSRSIIQTVAITFTNLSRYATCNTPCRLDRRSQSLSLAHHHHQQKVLETVSLMLLSSLYIIHVPTHTFAIASSPETITMLFYAVAQLLLLASSSAQLRGVRNLQVGESPPPPNAIELKKVLGKACEFAVLGASAITGASTCEVTNGHVGITAASLAAVVGFALNPLVPENDITLSMSVVGADHDVYGPSKAGPVLDEGTPAHDAKAAFDYIKGLQAEADFTDLYNGELGSQILTPGVYKFTGAVGLAGVLTFRGGATDVFIIQIVGAFTTAAAASMVLENGAKAENIYFQITGALTNGATTKLKGVYLIEAAVTLGASSLVDGSVFGQAAFTMGASTTINRQDSCPVV